MMSFEEERQLDLISQASDRRIRIQEQSLLCQMGGC